MKKNNIWYVGYGISLVLVLLLFFTDFHIEIDMAIGVIFSVIFAVSHTQILHSKMLRDDNEYRRNVLDERNIIIKEKAGNVTNMITLILLGCATVLFIALEYIVPAIVIGVIIFMQPIVLIYMSHSIEKKM